jgi:hypothetical protein
MSALDDARVNEGSQGQMQIHFFLEMTARRRAGLESVDTLQISGPAESKQRVGRIDYFADEDDGVAFVFEPLSGDMFWFFNQTNHGDGRCWINWTAGILIVQADVPAGHRGIESAASLGEPANGFAQLPENFRVKWVAEIEIVSRAKRSSACAGEVSGGLRHSDFAAFVRIEVDVSGVAIDTESDEFIGRDA